MHHLFLGGDDLATEVDVVYKQFLGMIDDEEWLLIEDAVIEDLMFTYLKGAIAEFDICRKDLTFDYAMYFIDDLDYSEINILAKGMLIQYLSPKIIREENLKQSVTSKDFSKLSNANMLDKLMKLKEMTRLEFDSLLIKYDYKNFEGLN